MDTFLCKICTYIYIRIINRPIIWLKKVLDLVDFLASNLNGTLQIVFSGSPFYWTLKYSRTFPEDRRLIILANGPSLNEDLERLSKENLSNADFSMMNFSVNSPLFFKYKPKYFCLADHAFFKGDYCLNEVREVYDKLDEYVDWDLTLIVSYNVKLVKDFSKITNPHIKFQRVFPISCPDFKIIKYWFYKRGFGIPGLGTVTNLAAFAGIQYGYKRIEFCGNDMSLFDGLCVNDENYPCVVLNHFYEDKVKLEPVMISETRHETLLSYVEMVTRMIVAHNAIAEYGKHMGVQFVNRTRKSMLDCYPRLIKIHPEEFEETM